MSASEILYASAVFCAVVTGILACSPEGYVQRTVTQRVHDADAVLFGRIVNIYPSSMWSDAYTAEMLVHCVIKGADDLPLTVNISEAGHVPGMCHSTDLQVGNEYILTLRMSHDRLIPDEYQIDAEKLQEAASTCGVTPHPPQGAVKVLSDNCPSAVGPDQCLEPNPPVEIPDAPVRAGSDKSESMGTADQSNALVVGKENGASSLHSAFFSVAFISTSLFWLLR